MDKSIYFLWCRVMFQPKEKFLDRIEQSFIIFREKFFPLVLPVLLFNIVLVVCVPYIFWIFFLSIVPLESFFSGDTSGILSNLSFLLSLIFTAGVFLVFLYVIIFIPIQIWILRTIRQWISGESTDISENIKYGFWKISDAFRTYWYIFSYTLLFPAMVFIVWGIFLNIGLYYNTSSTEIFTIIWGSLMAISVCIGIYFLIYRGTKSMFGLVGAVDSQLFTKENFQRSLSLSDGKWWRVFWNILGVTFLWGLLVWLIGGIWESLTFFGNDWTNVLQEQSDQQELMQVLDSFSRFDIFFFLNSVLQTSLNTILGVFITVFSYVLFRRLQIESDKKTSTQTIDPVKWEL